MKIHMERNTILPNLQAVANVAERRPVMPILSNLLLHCENDRITLLATDLEIELEATVPGTVEQGGKTTIPARKLYEICRSLPEGSQIRLESKDANVELRTGKTRFTLHTLPAEDYPYLSVREAAVTGICTDATLKEALEVGAVAMAQNDARYFLNGVLLETEGNHLRCIGTDGHRLSLMETPFASANGAAYQGILPRKAVLELLRILDGGDEELQIRLADTSFEMRRNGLRLASKLIDGKFPDYRRVIPERHPYAAQIDRATLHGALQQVGTLVGDKNPAVRMGFDADTLHLHTRNEEQEEADTELPVHYQGEAMEITFNIDYLMDATNVLHEESLSVTMKDPGTSAVFRGQEAEYPLYIVMPMRT